MQFSVTFLSLLLFSCSLFSLTEGRMKQRMNRSPRIFTLNKRDGQATFYEVGLGNCGGTNSNSEMVVAIAAPDVSGDTTSACGKTVKITNLETQIVQEAKVVDLCPGCSSGSLDMSPTLFQSLGGTEEQGVFPISYSFSDGSTSSGSKSSGSSNDTSSSGSSGSGSTGSGTSGSSNSSGSTTSGSSNSSGSSDTSGAVESSESSSSSGNSSSSQISASSGSGSSLSDESQSGKPKAGFKSGGHGHGRHGHKSKAGSHGHRKAEGFGSTSGSDSDESEESKDC